MFMNRTILSINGNRPMNYLLQTVLSGKYNFVPVQDVFAGMNELKTREEIKLIIIDIDFSAQENWEFIQHIRTSGLYQKPVIVLASDKSESMDEKMAEVDVYDFFYKPFNPPDLVRTIDKLMSLETMHN
jgi:two-component system, chemotaxis family, chemotaxis protein CheY